MDVQELKNRYYIEPEIIEKLESLGMFKEIEKRDFDNEDIRRIMEMINLMDMGIDNDKLVQFYHYPHTQLELLNQVRISLFHDLHEIQKKLDYVEYMIYQRKH